jgi:ketosteroid isomerase-like protein
MKRSIFVTTLILLHLCGHAQEAYVSQVLKTQLESINKDITTAFLQGNVHQLTSFYDEQAVCMPEHDNTLYHKKDIQKYFKHWFALAKTNDYQRTIYEIQTHDDYVFEIGTFTHNFSLAGKEPYHYAGKYFNVWKLKGNDLSLMAEIWGSNVPFDDKVLPDIPNKPLKMDHILDVPKKLEAEVKGRNSIIAALVKARNGGEHADLFMSDAIYLTYYSPMFVGIENIKAYFLDHEKPDDGIIDPLLLYTSKIIDLDSLVLEYGFYHVGWKYGNDSGIVKGKSINLWKRDSKGTLMMYRQMVNHD